MSNIVMKRRSLFPMAAAFGAATSVGIRSAQAAGYPSQTINFIIPYGPGGGFDAYGRKFAELMAGYYGNKVNVEPINMPGAAGREAIFNLSHDAPDGYNISLANVPGLFLQKSGGGLDLMKMSWVANLGRDSYGVAVSAKGPIKDVAGLQALSAQRSVGFSSTGAGSTDYFATKVLAASLGLKINIVSGYKGSMSSAVAVARGDVDVVVHSLTTLEKLQKSGLVRVIFVFQEKSPLPGVEDATSINKPDLGKIFQWRPVVAPPGLSPELLTNLSTALVSIAKSPDADAWAKKIHTTLHPLGQDETLDMIKTQKALVDKWRAVI